MKTIIHDLSRKEIKKFNLDSKDSIIFANSCKKSCIGCFSCWIKHPKVCSIKDNYSNIVESLKNSDELIIISKCRYGCYDSKVKKVFERCIGYVLPYFTIRENEIHHASRYTDNKLKFTAYFYGIIDEQDKDCAKDLVKANSINLNAKSYKVEFFNNLKEISKCLMS